MSKGKPRRSGRGGRGAVTDIASLPTKDDFKNDFEFVADLARFAEGIADEAAIRKKYRLTDTIWTQLADDDELVRAIESERIRRVRSGQQKRERAQKLVVAAPDILSGIMLSNESNPRHRIDAAAKLNDFADNGPGQSAPPSDRFQITINIGPETLTFDKSRRVLEPGEIDPDDAGDVDTGVIAAIAARKVTEGGGGQPL